RDDHREVVADAETVSDPGAVEWKAFAVLRHPLGLRKEARVGSRPRLEHRVRERASAESADQDERETKRDWRNRPCVRRHSGHGMNSSASVGISGNWRAFQASRARSIFPREDDTKFHSMKRGPSGGPPIHRTREAEVARIPVGRFAHSTAS